MKPPILMQTDFSRDESVAAMIGVVQSIDASLTVYDGNHAIAPFNIWQAATELAQLVDFWPKGSIFVSVVDPGVGTTRRGCVALLKNGAYVITPDNGTLTHLCAHPGIQAVREIDMAKNRLPTTQNCNIFHGRDVFAYTAARLAAGHIRFEDVGPAYPAAQVVTLPYSAPAWQGGGCAGTVFSAHPHFGLIASNIPLAMVQQMGLAYGDMLRVTITGGQRVAYRGVMPYQKSFGYVPKGAPLAYIGSAQVLEVTLHGANMVTRYNIGAGPGWRIHFEKTTQQQEASV